jgi:hypothetical protein
LRCFATREAYDRERADLSFAIFAEASAGCRRGILTCGYSRQVKKMTRFPCETGPFRIKSSIGILKEAFHDAESAQRLRIRGFAGVRPR